MPTAYASTGYGKVARFVNRQLLRKETVKTALKATALLDHLEKNMQTKSGLDFEVKVRTRRTNTAKTFIPEGGTSDYIGNGDPASAYPTQTFRRRNPLETLSCKFAFAVDDIRLDAIAMELIESPAKLIDYVTEHVDHISDDLRQFFAEQIEMGTGDGDGGALSGGTISNFYGLRWQYRGFSGTTSYGVPTADDTNNTHFGLKRHTHHELIGNVLNAGQVEDPAASTILNLGVGTLTQDSMILTFATAADFTVATDYRGWVIQVSTNGGVTYSDMGRQYRVVRYDNTNAAAVALQMQAAWLDTTVATYRFRIVAPFVSTIDGAANEFHINKLHRGYFIPCSGAEVPDFAACDSAFFYRFMTHLQAIQRWQGSDANLKTRGYENFFFNGARVIIDELQPASQIVFYNSSYVDLYMQSKFKEFKLHRGRLKEVEDGRGVETLVGKLIVGGQPVICAPNRCSVVTNLNL